MLDQTKTGLNAMQVAALRQANSVSFHHHAKDNASYIRATKRYREGDWRRTSPFVHDEDLYLEIPCDWRLREYTEGDDKIAYDSANFNAFDMIHASQVDEEWLTIVGLLRAGDALTLLWSRGGWTTQSMQNASPAFFGDSVSLQIARGDKRLTFHLRQSICENNSARMIRRA